MDRRSFMENCAGAVGSAPLSLGLISAFSRDSFAQESAAPLDQSVLNFWTTEIDESYKTFMEGRKTRGGPAWQPAFVLWDGAEFHTASTVNKTKLPKSGSATVSLRVTRFHPSDQSANKIRAKSGSLRIDLKQTAPLPQLDEVLAWSVAAALVPKSEGQLPNLKDLSFDPGQSWDKLQSIPLTNGQGFWGVNFFLTPPKTWWGEIVALFQKADTAIFPLLGLPAIAVSALTAVNKVFGYIQAKSQSETLFKSVYSPVCATQEALAQVGDTGLPLLDGVDYIVIPQDQLHSFGTKQANLKVVDGFLVKKDASEWDIVSDEVKDIDYITLHVGVKIGTDNNKSGGQPAQGAEKTTATPQSLKKKPD